MNILTKIQSYIDGLYVLYMRRKILDRKLEGLSDYGFLDRASSEKENSKS